MRLFGLYIERAKTRLDREANQRIRGMLASAEPTRELTREVRKLREAVVQEGRKSRNAAQCVSVFHGDIRPVRCRLPNGHAGDHRGDGNDWQTDEETAEAIR